MTRGGCQGFATRESPRHEGRGDSSRREIRGDPAGTVGAGRRAAGSKAPCTRPDQPHNGVLAAGPADGVGGQARSSCGSREPATIGGATLRNRLGVRPGWPTRTGTGCARRVSLPDAVDGPDAFGAVFAYGEAGPQASQHRRTSAAPESWLGSGRRRGLWAPSRPWRIPDVSRRRTRARRDVGSASRARTSVGHAPFAEHAAARRCAASVPLTAAGPCETSTGAWGPWEDARHGPRAPGRTYERCRLALSAQSPVLSSVRPCPAARGAAHPR